MHNLCLILELIDYTASLTVQILNFMNVIADTRHVLPFLSLVPLHILDPAILIQS